MSTCERDGCDETLRVAGKGRAPRFCSTRCRVAAHRSAALPAELTSRDRWVRWVPVRRGARWTKMPVTAAGAPASSTDSATWAARSEVRGASPDGRLGFVLGDGVGCIDLDHCLIGGVVAPWAVDVLAAAPATYIEVSPSGDGLHVWGLLPERAGRVTRDGRSIEVYSAGRFITITGKRWGGSPSRLADLSGLVAGL